ncbi:HHR253Cp [Eremothecium sinecaudum]|uniref:HHR253Cp n=1 Tax=Eremothecium sinecaudum TaxID=45286 RepID=A0A0X8HX01_9SACH|nr:HHR253Cp [Eremothecium sinecaudum]AMD23022.1 HHR253Cp [Eremothecium sinecaudum]
MVETTIVAVVCAIGLPTVISALILGILWRRAQLRLRKEDEDGIGGFIQRDSEILCTGDYKYLKNEIELKERMDYNGKLKDFGFGSEKLRSSTSGGSTSNEELRGTPDSAGYHMKSASASVGRGTSKYFIPAYRRRFNNSMSNQHINRAEDDSLAGSSILSFDAHKTSSLMEQMVPIITADNSGMFGASDMMCSDRASRTSNETLIKSLQTHDFGSYPKHKQSVPQLKCTFPFTTTPSPLMSGAPSTSSLNKLLRADSSNEDCNHSVDRNDTYILNSNYQMTNNSEIMEEDQYENEFTNYSRSKREFIDMLRPKVQS